MEKETETETGTEALLMYADLCSDCILIGKEFVQAGVGAAAGGGRGSKRSDRGRGGVTASFRAGAGGVFALIKSLYDSSRYADK